MIRQPLTDERLLKVQFSLQKMAILSEMMLIENQSELDVEFRVPIINNFAKRIGNDCKTIQNHLQKSGKMVVKVKDNEFAEEYSGEMYRIINLLAGLDVNIIKEFADNLQKEFDSIGIEKP